MQQERRPARRDSLLGHSLTRLGVVRAADEPDIVTEYAHVVWLFLLVQLGCWSFAALNTVPGAMGPEAYTVLAFSMTFDVCICQWLYLATLHRGALDASRLSFVCRIAFVLNALGMVLHFAFHNQGHMGFVDQGWVSALIWCVVWGVVCPWPAIQCLELARLRLLRGIGGVAAAPAFCDRAARIFIALLCAQVAVAAWCVASVVAAGDAEARARAFKTNRSALVVNYFLGQAYGMKVCLFEASAAGTTVAQAKAGSAPRSVYVGLVLMGAFGTLAMAHIAVSLAADSMASAELDIIDALDQVSLHNACGVGTWVAAAYGFNMRCGHLWSVRRTEAMLQAESEGAAGDEPAAGAGNGVGEKAARAAAKVVPSRPAAQESIQL